MRFRNYYGDETTELEGDVMGNFEYLENKNELSPGNYDVLKKIFAGDRKAMKKIENAINKIENIKSTAGRSTSNKGECLGHNYIVFFLY